MNPFCVLALAMMMSCPALAQPGQPEGPPRGPAERDRPGRESPPREVPMMRVGYIGLAAEPVSPELATQLGLPRGVGLTVVSVLPDSPAAAAGVQPHDVLHKLDDQLLVNTAQLRTLVQNHAAGDTVTLTLIRQAKSVTATVTVGETQVPQPGAGGPPPWAGGPARMMRLEPGDDEGPPRERPRDPRGGERGPRRDGEGPHGPGQRGEGWIHQLQRLETSSSRSSIGSASFKDNEHELRINMIDGKKTLVVKDATGQELFNGPINTPEERAAVPEAIKPKLDKLESTRPDPMSGQGPRDWEHKPL